MCMCNDNNYNKYDITCQFYSAEESRFGSGHCLAQYMHNNSVKVRERGKVRHENVKMWLGAGV